MTLLQRLAELEAAAAAAKRPQPVGTLALLRALASSGPTRRWMYCAIARAKSRAGLPHDEQDIKCPPGEAKYLVAFERTVDVYDTAFKELSSVAGLSAQVEALRETACESGKAARARNARARKAVAAWEARAHTPLSVVSDHAKMLAVFDEEVRRAS